MAIRTEIRDRIPLENVEIEYHRVGTRGKPVKAGFNRARLLDINGAMIEMAAREPFAQDERLTLTLHVKGVREFLQLDVEVKKIARISLLKQPAYSVSMQYGKLTADQIGKIAWAEDQLVPKQKSVTTLRREEEKSTVSAAPATSVTAAPPAPAPAAPAPEKPAEAAKAREQVKRPVALLKLIDALDKFEVTDDVIMAVIEAAEAGMDVEVLYPAAADSHELAEETASEEPPVEAEPPVGARPMNVYRISSNTRLYFSEANKPLGPAAELLYLSRLKSPDDCFAVELGSDSMQHAGSPSFRRGCILIFSTTDQVKDGDFAFVKTRAADEVAQVFFDKDEVRLHSLNSLYRERVVRRSEARIICRLIGHYEDIP